MSEWVTERINDFILPCVSVFSSVLSFCLCLPISLLFPCFISLLTLPCPSLSGFLLSCLRLPISSVSGPSVAASTPPFVPPPSPPRPLPHHLSPSTSISILSLFSFFMPVISVTLSLPWLFHLSPSLPLRMAGWVGLPQPSPLPANEQRSL